MVDFLVEQLGDEVVGLYWAHYVYMAAITFTTVMYTFAWVFPETWTLTVAKALDQHPSDAVATVCYFSKIAQGIMTLYCADFSSFPLSALAFAAVCIGIGQYLNFKVYQLLQHDGIFYGCRFGLDVPWVHDFPYSHIRDPQYVQCLLPAHCDKSFAQLALTLHSLFVFFFSVWLLLREIC